jgi:uncharacterized membrane protein
VIQEVLAHIHPIVVHFPIALIVIAACYDLISILVKRRLSAKQGFWLWVFAFLTAWLAVGTGPGEAARGITNLIHYHSKLADVTTALAFVMVVFRGFLMFIKKETPLSLLILYSLLSLMCMIAVLSTGYYGGEMVYDQGIGVKMNGKYVNPPKQGRFPSRD